MGWLPKDNRGGTVRKFGIRFRPKFYNSGPTQWKIPLKLRFWNKKKCIIYLFAQSPLNNSNFWCKNSMKPPARPFETIDLGCFFCIFLKITIGTLTWQDKKMMSAWEKHFWNDRYRENNCTFFGDHERKTWHDKITKWWSLQQNTFETVDSEKKDFHFFFSASSGAINAVNLPLIARVRSTVISTRACEVFHTIRTIYSCRVWLPHTSGR